MLGSPQPWFILNLTPMTEKPQSQEPILLYQVVSCVVTNENSQNKYQFFLKCLTFPFCAFGSSGTQSYFFIRVLYTYLPQLKFTWQNKKKY